MDTASYRLSESLGKQAMRSLRQTDIHAPALFEALGFRTRVESKDDLMPLLDTMHNNRFEDFVAELGGPSQPLVDELVDGFADYTRFFMANFPSPRVPIPMSGMVSQFALALKIRGAPKRARVLEIGAGTGLVSFFLARDQAIERYDQVEVTESFYLLQSLVNRHVYGHRFVDHAQLDATAAGLGGIAFDEVRAIRGDLLENYDIPHEIEVERRPRAEHFPWWRLDRIFQRRYDVVTSNANLTEFNEPALRYYATLAARVLEPDGMFLAQCLGGGRNPIEKVLRTMISAGLAPLVVVPRSIGAEAGSPTALPEGRQVAVATLIFVPVGHPSHARAAHRGGTIPIIDAADPLTRSVLGFDRPAGPTLSRADLLAAIADRLLTLA